MPALAAGECPEQPMGKYPGWSERFFNSTDGLPLGNTTTIDDFDIKVTKIIGTSAARFEVLRHSSPYFTDSVEAGEDRRLKKDDIMIELYNIIGANKANVSIYTPQRANITVNLTNVEVLKTVSGRISLMPSEEFEIELQLNNTGELEAKDVKIDTKFGDFEVLSSDARAIPSMCPGSVESILYRMKAPYRSTRFNFTLYFNMEYSDTNLQLGRVIKRTETYPIEVEILPTVLTVEREVSNWSLLHQGRTVRVQVTINNTGDFTAYGVKWIDLPPPDLFVIGGTTSWEDDLPGGRTKRFIYEVISDDPIACIEVSRITYKDRLGNKYQMLSEETTTRFSPNVTVYKTIGKRRWDIQEENPIITINHTENITVEIKNSGNAIAKNLLVNETLNGLGVEGTTFWRGDLAPDETVSYSYTVTTGSCKGTSRTTVNYSDIDTRALNKTFIDVEGKCACYCTKTLEEVIFNSSEEVNGLFPDLNITVANGTNRSVIPACVFDLNITLKANASDSIHDVSTYVDLTEFLSQGGHILTGQAEYFEPVLKATYFPGCSVKRSWLPNNRTYALQLASPAVTNKTTVFIPITVKYRDVYGWHTKNVTVNLTVLPALHACRRVTVEKKDIEIRIDYADEVTLERAGDFNIKIKNTGYSALENVTLILHNPKNIEAGTNDSRWLGRIEYQVKRANDTLYVYTGDMEINESIDVRKEILFPLQMSGTKAGDYVIQYEVRYAGKRASGEVPLRVKGAILKISKELDREVTNVSDRVKVKVTVENVGDDVAGDVVISDYPPAFVQVKGERERTLNDIKPGESVTLEYEMRFSEEGSYPIDPAVVTWKDRLGNEYSENSNKLRLEVGGISIEEKLEVEPPMTPLSKGELVITVMFSIITLGILFKILSMTRPVS
jgi:hypothetical protein